MATSTQVAMLLIESMQKFGYARLRLDGTGGQMFKSYALSASQILTRFFSGPLQSKLRYRRMFHSGKFVGYADEGPRQYYQVIVIRMYNSHQILHGNMDRSCAQASYYLFHAQIKRNTGATSFIWNSMAI